MARTVHAKKLNAGDTYYVSGKVTYSRVTRRNDKSIHYYYD